MLAKDLIDRLERLGLLDQEIIDALRQQLDQGGTRVTPEAVAKLLVDNGQLTSFQASKLIGELRSGQYEEESAPGSDEIDLTAGIEEVAVEEAEVEVVEEAVYAEPMEVEAVPVEAVAAESVDSMADDSSAPRPERPSSRRKKPDPQKSVWDSFKIYGYLGIIALLLIVGGGLGFILTRENADAVIEDANSAYDQQNYQAAQDKYLGFLDGFGEEHEYSSISRTRVVMTQLYKAAAFKQEPWQAVDLAKEKLPEIAEETGMNDERGNLAALLVDIAANLARSAGKAKETTKKEELLAKMDEHRTLMEDPLYMPSTMRVTLAGQIKAVEEARERVQRDIDRNKRLDAAEAAMKTALAAKETKKAYDIRLLLLADFPELAKDERLVTLIQEASTIQETLVSKSTELPKTTGAADEQDDLKTIVLTTRAGVEAPDLRGETLYLRAGGSVLALDGFDGQLKWRKFVGYAKDLPPVRIDDGYGVLLSDSAKFEVLRCEGQSGDVIWRSTIGESFSEPVVVKNDAYLTTDSGRLIALDTDSGDPKWATQIPQELETGVGVDDRLKRIYLPGNHSNLYLLDARSGSCLESFYLGHSDGTIAVPPVPLLEHVFVIENRGTDYAMVHVLRVDDKGEGLRVAQPPFRLTGNVRVPPIIQGRRLIVLTDRGEVVVYDIEPTAEGEQVSVAAKLPPFYDEPTATQMAVGRTSMWITGTRVGRYELQINTGQVVRDWSMHELDQFIGEPFAGDDTLVHARVLRGTSAIRITAADPKTGVEIWRTDVGVPIAHLTRAEKGIHAITTQAALFELGSEALAAGSTQGPIENAGSKSVGIRYEEFVAMEDGRGAFLDQGGGENVLIYDPNRKSEKVRQVTMRLPSGRPSGGMAYSGGGLFMPLTTGRAVLINWQTGAVVSTPFQPQSNPAESTSWTNPILLPSDADQVVIADDRKKIYRLRVSDQIRDLASNDLDAVLLGRAACIGDVFVAGTAGPAADFLVGYDTSSLDQAFKTLLPGRMIWGPVAAEDQCLLMTDDGELRSYDSSGKELMSVEVPKGKPVGQPLIVDGKMILVGKSGWFATIDLGSGQMLGQGDLGQPISATPLNIKNRLLIPGSEGVIYIETIPGL